MHGANTKSEMDIRFTITFKKVSSKRQAQKSKRKIADKIH